MKTFRWKGLAVLAAMLLVCSWITYAQKSTTTKAGTTTVSKATAMRQRVEARGDFLVEQERRRLEILDDLEFTPRPRPRGGSFPMLCKIPIPTPAADIDPHRSLFVHDRPTLDGADFTLNRTLTQIANNVVGSVPGTTAVSIFRQLWDTQSTAPGLVATSPHCSDNGQTINGFPIDCPRAERNEAAGTNAQIVARMAEYAPLALVNRMDLAHQGWRNCGEYRIVYGRRATGKNLIIFEAVLPNPKPGCREGCLPVAQFWRNLSTINNAGARAARLADFFYNGLPGFRPVVHVNHYSATGVSTGYGSSGSGQIRTNQFLQQPWMLKEFKTVVNCTGGSCTFNLVPISVKVNPQGNLWNENDPHPLGPNFRAETLAQRDRLDDANLMKIGYEVALVNNAGQSISQSPFNTLDNYRLQMNFAPAGAFKAGLGIGTLTSDQMANRAIAQSCAGCHQPSHFDLTAADSIGLVNAPAGSPVATTDSWPDSVQPAGFVHVDTLPASVRPELAANPAAYGAGVGQQISPALLDFFLPDRKNFLVGQLNAQRCNCVPRFKFLPPAKQKIAFDIEARVHKQFAERFEALETRQLEAQTLPQAERDAASVMAREKESLLAEREKAVASALQREGITLPEMEQPDLRVQTMRLSADTKTLVREVNALLAKEPPRRTVTGSFRVH